MSGASPRYHRSTASQMVSFRRAVWDVCARYRPLSARQTYYRAVVSRLIGKDVGKSRANEKRLAHAMDVMRERYAEAMAALDGDLGAILDLGADAQLAFFRDRCILPMEWISDNTRVRYQADLHGSAADALADVARFYRRDLWRAQPVHVEVWCESDSIGGVLQQLTDEFGVALLPCRGQSSKRFIWDSAQSYQEIDKPVVCLYVGDFDPAGLDIAASVEDRLRRYGAPDVEFRKLAITPEQVRDLGLPGHGLNPNHPRAVLRRFIGVCDEHGIPREAVEAEALPPDDLRQLVREAILTYIDQRRWELELAVERSERVGLAALRESYKGQA